MHPAHSARDFDADGQVTAPSPALADIQKFILIAGGCEPFPFLFIALDAKHVVVDGAVLEEKMGFVSRTNDAEFAIVFDDFGGPAKQFLPIIAAFLTENTFAEEADDVLEAVFGGCILFVTEEADDIRFIGAEVHILHAALADHLVDVFDGAAVCGFDSDDVAHGVA